MRDSLTYSAEKSNIQVTELLTEQEDTYAMKYNFDEVVDRIHEEGSYSVKWADGPWIASAFKGEPAPEDRLCFFTADMDYRCAPEIVEAVQTVAKHGIFG